MCIYNGKVSVDVKYGSLRNVKNKEESTTITTNKNEAMYKGGVDPLLDGEGGGMGRRSVGQRDSFQARNKV